jgi:hygromycin-B 7''-O-kinase
MTEGRPGRVQALFTGYGYGPDRIDDALVRRLLTLTFLHRASDPMRKIAIPDWPAKASTLEKLGRQLWPR